jgi:hypothetical protein
MLWVCSNIILPWFYLQVEDDYQGPNSALFTNGYPKIIRWFKLLFDMVVLFHLKIK